MNRNTLWLLAAILLGSIQRAEAQQPEKIRRIGILFIGSRDQPHLTAFKQGLRERGYTEGKDIVLEYRYAEGRYDRLPQLAKELARMKVDVIVTTSVDFTTALRFRSRILDASRNGSSSLGR